jgi:hypothetical protein
MLHQTTIEKQLNEVFSQRQSTVLAGVISEAYDELRAREGFQRTQRDRAHAGRGARTHPSSASRNWPLPSSAPSSTSGNWPLPSSAPSSVSRNPAVAQQRTERALEHLSRQVGGLSNRLGGDLEDVAYAAIQDVLKRELGWNVGRLGPSWQQWNGKKEEVDVLGTATDPSRPHERSGSSVR